MQFASRTLTVTLAVLVTLALCLFAAAAPQSQQVVPTWKPPAPPDNSQQQAADRSSPSAISLSDSDGQQLILEDLSARAAIHGMLSLTELEFRFRNPKPRRIEGRFNCTLPANAAISRFAKEVNGQLMEGEVVERLRANQVYEQFLHQMRDPALLEQDQGNRFSARIFPIEANATVRILISYSTLLPLKAGVRTYTLPLRGVGPAGHFAFRAFVSPLPGEETVGEKKAESSGGGNFLTRSTADVYSLEKRDYTPDRDIELAWRPSEVSPRMRLIRAGNFYLAALRSTDAQPESTPGTHSWIFYVDTSASAAEGAAHRVRALEALLAALPSSDRVMVNAFDHNVVPLGSGTAAEMSKSIGRLLNARLFLGGTDLNVAIRHAARAASDEPSRAIVFVSDLVATLGATSSSDIAAAIRTIPQTARVHALVLGYRQDASTAKALTAGRGRVVTVPFTDSLEQSAAAAATQLRAPMGRSLDAADANAEWIYPSHFDDVRSGDEVIVLGKTAASEPQARIAGLSADGVETLPGGTFEPLLEREAYRAYLAYLAERAANEPAEPVRRALETEQVKVSIEQRVIIPQTTMLVLESEWDYQRFGLDRRALAAILTIDAGGIARIDRRTQAPRPIIVQAPNVGQPVPKAQQGGRAAARPAATAEGGVTNGVVGGVVGGSISASSVSPVRTEAVSEAITVTAAAPVLAAAPPPQQVGDNAVAERITVSTRPEARAARNRPAGVEAKDQGLGWLRHSVPSKEEIKRLQTLLDANRSDRGLYNQLSEALAAAGRWEELRGVALQWQPYDPENPQVYEVLGLADEHLGRKSEAARAYASIIEIAPAKTELLQRAGLLLVRVGQASLAETPLRRALELRPDRVNSYRHLALMLWLDGRPDEAAHVLESATKQTFPNWYGNAQRVVREELGYVYRTIASQSPHRRAELEQRAAQYGVDMKRLDALRVTLAWETDANDVDLHVVDPANEECFYSHKINKSGLELYEDITQGLGPEVIRTAKLDKGTYHVGVRYFSAGPMGVSRGLVVVMRDAGEGRDPSVEVYPFRLIEGGGDVRYVAAVNVK